MRSDSEIMHDGVKAIFLLLDLLEAERFIALMRREKLDYTEWRKNLFEGMSIEELSAKAMEHWNKKKES